MILEDTKRYGLFQEDAKFWKNGRKKLRGNWR